MSDFRDTDGITLVPSLVRANYHCVGHPLFTLMPRFDTVVARTRNGHVSLLNTGDEDVVVSASYDGRTVTVGFLGGGEKIYAKFVYTVEL